MRLVVLYFWFFGNCWQLSDSQWRLDGCDFWVNSHLTMSVSKRFCPLIDASKFASQISLHLRVVHCGFVLEAQLTRVKSGAHLCTGARVSLASQTSLQAWGRWGVKALSASAVEVVLALLGHL